MVPAAIIYVLVAAVALALVLLGMFDRVFVRGNKTLGDPRL